MCSKTQMGVLFVLHVVGMQHPVNVHLETALCWCYADMRSTMTGFTRPAKKGGCVITGVHCS